MEAKIQLITNNNSTIHNTDISHLERIIGQKSAINKLKFFVNSHSSDYPVPTLLFTGSHGLGKTYLAEKMANAMGRRLIEINCGIIQTEKDLIENILISQVVGESCVTLFFDESHKLNTEVTTILLSLLNPSAKNQNIINYKNLGIVFDLSKINVIFATTDAHKMFGPLKNRCQEIYFNAYEKDDLINILKLYCKDIDLNCDLDDLSDACRGRARNAFVLSQNINRYFNGFHGKRILEQNNWDTIKNIFEIHAMGLNKQEIQLLKIIYDNNIISASNIALTMMVNVDNIESEIEIRPRELGLIKSTTRGRTLTEKGIEYIDKLVNK
jgi:holliday junction DNA helicase RuvB